MYSMAPSLQCLQIYRVPGILPSKNPVSRSLGFPGFPVEGCGFEQLHVVLFEENHISGTGESCEVGNPGTLGMTERRGSL
jgi:hypothetical protein